MAIKWHCVQQVVYLSLARVYELDDRDEELAGCDIIVNAAGHIEAAALTIMSQPASSS